MSDWQPNDKAVCISANMHWTSINGNDINPGPGLGEVCHVILVGKDYHTGEPCLGFAEYKFGSDMKKIYYYAKHFIKITNPEAIKTLELEAVKKEFCYE